MAYKMTTHAKARCQQRGVSSDVINLILNYGIESSAGGGLARVWIDRATYNYILQEFGAQVISVLDKARDFYLIVAEGRLIITAAPTTRRHYKMKHAPHPRCSPGRSWPTGRT